MEIVVPVLFVLIVLAAYVGLVYRPSRRRKIEDQLERELDRIYRQASLDASAVTAKEWMKGRAPTAPPSFIAGRKPTEKG